MKVRHLGFGGPRLLRDSQYGVTGATWETVLIAGTPAVPAFPEPPKTTQAQPGPGRPGTNLACLGCGKIQYPAHILRQRMSVRAAIAAVEECGAPMVSIAGGEPLIHPEVHLIAAGMVARRKFVYFCANALLMRKKMDNFTPSPYFAWAVHLYGLRERHDASVDHAGTFDEALAAIRQAQRRGFRVTTNTTFFNTGTPQTVREVLDFLNDELRVDQMMISPAYAYWKARRVVYLAHGGGNSPDSARSRLKAALIRAR